MSEAWAGENTFCPICWDNIFHYSNNKPVADFYCKKCNEDFELKSGKTESFSNVVLDGSYKKMIERLESSTNPNFFVLQYNKHFEILNLIAIPKYFVRTSDIFPRKKWIPNRPEYIMCNISMAGIPESGKIHYIQNGKFREKWYIMDEWRKTCFITENSNLETKWWLLDIMHCIDMLWKNTFSLKEIYEFESYLAQLHPENNHIPDKIRQQLQKLIIHWYIARLENGIYQKL